MTNATSGWLSRTHILLAAAVLLGCGDTPTDQSLEKGPTIQGTWDLTLWLENGDSAATSAVNAGVQIFEHHGLIVGFVGAQRLEGWRIEEDVLLQLLTQSGEDGTERWVSDATLRLTLLPDGTLRGAGVYHQPVVEVPVDRNGNVHEKFAADTARSLEIELWGAAGVKTAELDDALQRAAFADPEGFHSSLIAQTREGQRGITCDAASAVMSFMTGLLTGNLLRPMSDCWLNWEGGGYYVFGHQGPGSLLPYWTQTIYHPQELSACQERTYKFHVKSGSRVTLANPVSEFLDLAEFDGFLEAISGTFFPASDVKGFLDELDAYTGGYAFSLAVSGNTGSVSLYFNVRDKPGFDRWLKSAGYHTEYFGETATSPSLHPFIASLQKGISEKFSGAFYFFYGEDIVDTFSLNRNPLGIGIPDLCESNDVVFVYLFGTIDVEFI